MAEILTVCTGNICRSPLAAQLLAAGLRDLDVTIASAGTGALPGARMTNHAARSALARGVPPEVTAAHRARRLSERLLASADVVFALTREHRGIVLDLAPARVKSVFTLREFARLASGADDATLRAAAEAGGDAAADRLRAVVATIAGRRGLAERPADPRDDDVIDPYLRSWETYEVAAGQIEPAVAQIVRVARIALDAAS